LCPTVCVLFWLSMVSLSGYLNIQNNRKWSSEKLYVVHEVALHNLMIRAWNAISAPKNEGVNSFRQDNKFHIMKDSDLSLTDLEHKHSTEFMQDSADNSVNVTAEFSGEYAVSKRLWPDHSANLI